VSLRHAAAAGLLGWLGSACDTTLDRDLEGLACRAEGQRCLAGYVCSADNRCVREGTDGAGGSSGGSSGSSGSGGGTSGAGVGGSGGDPVVGAAGAPDAGGQGGYRYDAGPGLDALDASVLPDAAGCDAPVLLFRDEDEDGFGVTSQDVVGCPQAKWALEGGDCRDDLPEVHPRQLEFFAVGYDDPTRRQAGNVSFDYDCDFTEAPAPDTSAAPACNDPLTCEGGGYVAVSPARSGPGVNGICGSTQFVVCQSTTLPLLGLTCSAEPLDSAGPATCR